MKHILRIFLITVVACLSAAVAAAQMNALPARKPSAQFDRIWIDYDVKQEGRNGMRVHVAFSLKGLKGKSVSLKLIFLDEDEAPLPDSDGRYQIDGVVSISKALKPVYDPAVYKDMSLFMPYSELGLGDGTYRLGVDADIVYPDGKTLTHLGSEFFDYSQGEEAAESDSGVSAEIKGLTVTQNVSRDGRRGLLVRFSLDKVVGLKGRASAAAVHVQDMDGQPILADSGEYANESGELAAVFRMKPAYDPAKYDKVEIFIPYDEIVIGRGTRKLKLDIDLIADDWEVLQHLAFREFQMTRK